MTWGIFKRDSVSATVEKVQKESWDDMLKAVKDKNATQPNGGSGKKQGTRYGGGKQKEDESEKRKEKNESVDNQHKYKVYSNAHPDPEHHTTHDSLESAKKEYAKHSKTGGAMYHGDKLYNKKTDKFESVEVTGEQLDEMISEVLSADQDAGKWISDFVKSDNPKFAGKSPEKRKQMALAAYYSAQKKESTDYESFVVLDEEKQAEIVKMGAKEIKHANMKDKQDDAEIMEPHSEGEANFIDQHYVNVTDDPTAVKQDGGAGKLGKAAEPKGQGAGKYDGKNKTGIKEGTSEEGSLEESCSQKSAGKKNFRSFKAKVTG